MYSCKYPGFHTFFKEMTGVIGRLHFVTPRRRGLYRHYGNLCSGAGKATAGRPERRRNRAVDALFNAKNRKELEEMAKQNEYMDEAYQELDRLSADEEKRLEYETRLKI